MRTAGSYDNSVLNTGGAAKLAVQVVFTIFHPNYAGYGVSDFSTSLLLSVSLVIALLVGLGSVCLPSSHGWKPKATFHELIAHLHAALATWQSKRCLIESLGCLLTTELQVSFLCSACHPCLRWRVCIVFPTCRFSSYLLSECIWNSNSLSHNMINSPVFVVSLLMTRNLA